MKKYLLIAIITIPFFVANSQTIGDLAPEKKLIVFPDNALGVDVIFSEGGFGLGGFYRRQLNQSFTFFTDFSISESKDDREMEYIDYWGQTFVPGKKNRIFIFPLNLGLQYRLFKDAITDNLRPYINVGVGPSMVVTTPYEREFFSAFGKAHSRFTVGGYIGFGANIGIDEDRLLGLNVRYYVIQFFDEGVEGLRDRFQKTLGGFFLTLNFGTMY